MGAYHRLKTRKKKEYSTIGPVCYFYLNERVLYVYISGHSTCMYIGWPISAFNEPFSASISN